jgi:hypothetical protein
MPWNRFLGSIKVKNTGSDPELLHANFIGCQCVDDRPSTNRPSQAVPALYCTFSKTVGPFFAKKIDIHRG